MIQNRLGAVRDADAPFPPDRIVAVVLRVAFVIGVGLTVRNTMNWWEYYQRRDPSLTYLGYLQQAWWVHARYLVSSILAFWLTFALAKGQRWSFVCYLLLGLGDLAVAVHYVEPYNLGLFSFELVYATMRLTGSLGAKPTRRIDEREVSLRLDLYFALSCMFISVVSDVLYVNSTLRGWHHAQDKGTIAYLPYLAQRWWSRVGYVGEEILVWWVAFACFRSRRWAFVVLGMLSVCWLFYPLHKGDAFYLWSNAYTLTYCTGRLLWPRPRP